MSRREEGPVHLVVLTRRVPETRAAAARALMRAAPELCAAIAAELSSAKEAR